MYEMVRNYVRSDDENKKNKIDVVNNSKITREKRSRRLVNKKEVKQYQIVYDK